MNQAWIALGTNLGNRKKNIRTALCEISKRFKIQKVSTPIRTKPYGKIDQNDFINLVVWIETELSPQNLLSFLLETENKMGRVRTTRWGPRIIDLDLLFYDQRIIRQSNLILPHPDLHNRLFVLRSLQEISPNLKHPLLNQSVQEIYYSLLEKKSKDLT